MPMKAQESSTKRRAGGFSLPELLVSMALALIALLVIGSVVLTNDRFQRATIGTSDAQTTGSLALYAIERDARMAGYGLANSNALGCSPIQYYYSAGGAGCGAECYSRPANAASALPDLGFAPVVIENGAAGAPDAVTFAFANPRGRVIPGTLKEDMTQPSADLRMEEITGFAANELIVAFQPGVGCALMQVTQVQGAAAQRLLHDSGGGAPYNPDAGSSLFPAFTKGALVFNMGRPIVRRYDVANTQLRIIDYFSYASATALPTFNTSAEILYDQIVDLQAEYGKDTDNDQVVDTWDNVTPAPGSPDWLQILAIRVGVLARSKDEARPEGGACRATTVLPAWEGGDFALPGGVPSCFKYRVFETVIPLRNMIWRES